MPLQVLGEDGRELHDKLQDSDAHDLAQRVHAATGEVLTLIPWVEKKGEYVLDKASARLFPESAAKKSDKPATKTEPTGEPDVWKMKGAALDKLAAEHKIEGYSKSAKVADKRKMVADAIVK